MKRRFIRAKRIEGLNIHVQHVAQIMFPLLSAVIRRSVIKSFRIPGIDALVDDNHLCSRVIPGFTRCLLNLMTLLAIMMPKETEDKGAEKDMELDFEEWYDLVYDFNAPDEEEE
jgi:hypothetical protein